MPVHRDGPKSELFTPIRLRGDATPEALAKDATTTPEFRERIVEASSGTCVCWGIPFEVGGLVTAFSKPVKVALKGIEAPWLVFLHTTDRVDMPLNESGFVTAPEGHMCAGGHAADYVFCYGDGEELRVPIRWRYEIGMIMHPWGEYCFQAQAHVKPHSIRNLSEQPMDGYPWGWTQTRVAQPDFQPWINWVWAWENPRPKVALSAVRIEPKRGKVVLSAISSGTPSSHPLRWERRRKAVLTLPKGAALDKTLDRHGLSKHIQLDLGQVISITPRPLYPNDAWPKTHLNEFPKEATGQVLMEYTAHPDARFHLEGGTTVPVASIGKPSRTCALEPVAPATQRVTLRVLEKASGRPVPVRLHVHGQAGEYLAPTDRHRQPNAFWFEDYGCEYLSDRKHTSTYIPGETVMDLPLGKVFVEISKGFEIRPTRKVVNVTRATSEIVLTVEKVLHWRERGWATADTHVHFLSPRTAQLEGEAEGVNVVNLLASQWGELMTNVGDFDGKTTFGAKEAGGSGEYLVRVGTENRQHVMGHISLLGYNGRVITPMTVGGPDEAALGDPVDILLMEWARLCRDQGGLVVFPHFPQPRAENAAAFIEGLVDGVEMTSSAFHYGGINPYALSDWYRYLNCGYFVPAVGGTDKMSAGMLLGALRTYAKLPKGRPFDYQGWMDAVRAGNTFVTFGPLLEFTVGGKAPGHRVALKRSGGTLDVEYAVASATVPMTRVELVVNGEIRESRAVKPREDAGYWSVKVERSSWIALLIRGHYADTPEYIAAHSSPVMAYVEGSRFYSAADALTILEQLQGAMAYLDTLATPCDPKAYKRMRLALEGAYRKLHNRMHEAGHDHPHTHVTDHKEHH